MIMFNSQSNCLKKTCSVKGDWGIKTKSLYGDDLSDRLWNNKVAQTNLNIQKVLNSWSLSLSSIFLLHKFVKSVSLLPAALYLLYVEFSLHSPVSNHPITVSYMVYIYYKLMWWLMHVHISIHTHIHTHTYSHIWEKN